MDDRRTSQRRNWNSFWEFFVPQSAAVQRAFDAHSAAAANAHDVLTAPVREGLPQLVDDTAPNYLLAKSHHIELECELTQAEFRRFGVSLGLEPLSSFERSRYDISEHALDRLHVDVVAVTTDGSELNRSNPEKGE